MTPVILGNLTDDLGLVLFLLYRHWKVILTHLHKSLTHFLLF